MGIDNGSAIDDWGDAGSSDGQDATISGSVWGLPDAIVAQNYTIHSGSSQSQAQVAESGGTLRSSTDPAINMSGEAALQSLYYMDPDQLQQLQSQLFLGGYYGSLDPKKILWGQADPRTYNAYGKLLTAAAQSGKALDELLREGANPENAGRLGGSGGGGGVRTNVIQHASQEDLEAAALRGFQAATGHAPSADQQAAFIAEFRKKETASQPSTAGGGTFNITDPGNAVVGAEAAARKALPADAQSYSRLQKFGVMLQALGVSGSG